MAVDIGAEAIDRADSWSQNYTIILATNPASVAGFVTSIDIYLASNCTAVEVAIFEHLGSNFFTTRSNALLGDLVAGLHAGIAVNLAVEVGDYIGYYIPTAVSGGVDRDNSGGAGEWFQTGDKIPCTNQAFNANLGARIHSLGGYIPTGWSGKVSGVTDPAKVMGIAKANIGKVMGVS